MSDRYRREYDRHGDIITGVRGMRGVREVREVRAVRRVREVLRVLRVLRVLVVLGVVACGREEEPPIRLKGAWLVVENQTKTEWREVSVTVNAYYKGVAPRVAPGGRLEAPLAGFTTGFGKRFNAASEHVMRVEVRATDPAGRPVALDWDEHSGKPLAEHLRER